MCVWVLAPTAVALVPVAVCVGGCDGVDVCGCGASDVVDSGFSGGGF